MSEKAPGTRIILLRLPWADHIVAHGVCQLKRGRREGGKTQLHLCWQVIGIAGADAANMDHCC